MCDTCGCGQADEQVTIRKPGDEFLKHSHDHHHDSEFHSHTHDHSHNHSNDSPHHHHDREILVEQDVLLKNNLLAERNRGYFEAKELTVLNLVSSPGSGKTSLLERTLKELKNKHRFYVIEGDQQTMNDAERIHKTETPVVQINTGQGCHLDSSMIQNALKEFETLDAGYLIIENVGNLVCPALFDLGETKRVVIMSVTEGEDKPIKYPTMFKSADLCVINKTDLLPYLDFDLKKAIDYAKQVNHKLEFIELSVRSGDGMEDWYKWIENLRNSK